MTTIAANKNQIAGDLMLSHSNGITFKSGSKLLVYDNKLIYPKKFVVGYAGNIEIAMKLLEYFNAPDTFKLHKKWEGCEFLVLTEGNKLFTFSDPRVWFPVKSPFYALGSGCHFAMGAMSSGKTPKEAVKEAIKLDKGSGYGVTSYSFP